jgi:hypothetical protein
MLRYLQTQQNKPVEILPVDGDTKRGAVVTKDITNGEIEAVTSGLGEALVDVSPSYDGSYAATNPTETSFETIKDGAKGIYVPAVLGDRFATTEITATYAKKGHPLTATNGKFVKASGAASYQWIYGGAYQDPTGLATHIVERVAPATAPATRTMSYNANTGTGTMTDPASPYYQGDKAIALDSTFTPPTGKVFSKWNTAANGSGTNYLPGAEIAVAAANITLYAIWEDEPA